MNDATAHRRLMVVGLDCLPPALAFEHCRAIMPTLTSLCRRGSFGQFRSPFPPITVPAWASLFSGCDAGALGVYGFRYRKSKSYDLCIAQACDLQAKMLWDLASNQGKRVGVIAVPPSYPPSTVNGSLVSCFLTPHEDANYTFPVEVKEHLRKKYGPYRIDVEMHADVDQWLAELHALSEQRFLYASELWQKDQPDLLVMVDISTDRLHHRMWQYIDASHPLYESNHPLNARALAFYRDLDQRLAALAKLADRNTVLAVLSDHGAKPMLGAFRINTWLEHQGYLRLKQAAAVDTRLSNDLVDWSRTRAWAEGGYYGRLYLNIKGREPAGVVPAAAKKSLLEEIARKLRDEESCKLDVYQAQDLYREVKGHPSDLMIIAENLSLRIQGTLGHRELIGSSSGRAADHANHDWHAMFAIAGDPIARHGRIDDLTYRDVFQTLCGVLDLDAQQTCAIDWSQP